MQAVFDIGPIGVEFSVNIYNPTYARRTYEGVIPAFIISSRSAYSQGRIAHMFNDENVDAGKINANIRFQEEGKIMDVTCMNFNAFKTSSLSGLSLCNQILSTFKFIK